jgi:tetratricopeptide (TPR) repeat protein/HPt (histidine-containing phosphotransfer) domain-containing protein
VRLLLAIIIYGALLSSALTSWAGERLPDLRRLYDLKSMSGPEVAWPGAVRDLQKALEQKNQKQQAEILGFLLIDGHDTAELEKLIPDPETLRAEVKTAGWEDQLFLLQSALTLKAVMSQEDPSPDLFRKTHEEAIQGAMDRELPELAGMITENLAYWEHDRGEFEEALAHCQKALSFLGPRLAPDDNFVLSLKNSTAMILEFKDEVQAAYQLYRDVLGHLRRLRRTFGLASVSHNYAQALAKRQLLKEAGAAYEETLKHARALKNELLEAVALKGLAFIKHQQRDFIRSNELLDQALEIFERLPGAEVGVADVWRKRADNHIGLKNGSRALESVERASLPAATADKAFYANLEEIRAQALRLLRRDAEAYDALIHAQALHKEVIERERRADISRLKVQMGLTIEEQRNHILTQENFLQKERLKQSELERQILMGLALFAVLGLAAAAFMLYQHREIRRSHQELRYILNHIEEGIVSIGPSMKIEAQISPYLRSILDRETQGTAQEDLLHRLIQSSHLPASERAQVYATLEAVLGADLVTWELNAHRLPQEIRLQSARILALIWQPLLDRHGGTQQIILTVRDITEARRLSLSMQVLEEALARRNQMLLQLMNVSPKQWPHLLHELEKFSREIEEVLEERSSLPGLRRSLHTLKGLARSMQFTTMASSTHQIEDMIPAGITQLAPEQKGELQDLLRQLHDYRQLLVEFTQQPSQGQAPATLGEFLAEALHSLIRSAEKEGMHIDRLILEDHFRDWQPHLIEAVQMLSLHALNNSLDHGFVWPRRRGERETSSIWIRIAALREGDELVYSIADNGAGINTESLRKRAMNLNIPVADDETLLDLLLKGGLSTAEEVTERSGRGLGLSAMAALCRESGGSLRISIHAEWGGTLMEARLNINETSFSNVSSQRLSS